ncbi:hypothetical protein [Pelagibius sp. Alg239-R121]|uniref:hypothetical protein n=1 Tax=Pelagibius sp. Alg239-R121 TaxID=2993448 RepID=UPI0024A6C34C|nr:hypothetical protein [Pelagibius sp. Alg239-R121]
MEIDAKWLETAALTTAVVMTLAALLLFLGRRRLYRRFLTRCNGAQSERRVMVSLLTPICIALVFAGVWIWYWQIREETRTEIALPAASSVKSGNTTIHLGGTSIAIGKNSTSGIGGIGLGTNNVVTGKTKTGTNKSNTGKKAGTKIGSKGVNSVVPTSKPSKPPTTTAATATTTATTTPTKVQPDIVVAGTKQAPSEVASCLSQGIISASQDCLDIAALVKKLAKAPIAYNRPQTMYRGEPEQISLVIDPAGTADLKVEMRALTGEVIETKTEVTRKMSAEIAGSLFEIMPAGAQLKTLSPIVPTRWDWRITPQKEGDAPLTLNVYVVFEQAGEKKEVVAVRSYTDPIQVDVHAIDQVGDVVSRAEPIYAFVATVTTGLFGFCVWLVTRWRKLKATSSQT